MKTYTLFVLALAAGFSPAASYAQAARTAAEKTEETCPCSNYRFVAKTEKARAVVAYWEARRKVKSAGVVGTFALLGAALTGRPTQTLNEAEQALGQAQSEMYSARAHAAELGGLKVVGAGEDATSVITLEKGVDYTLDGR